MSGVQAMPDSQPSPSWTDRHLWQLRPLRDLFWIGLALFVLWLGYHLRSIFTPVLIALVLAYLFTPVIDLAERRCRMARPLTISLILVVLLLAGLGLAICLGPVIVDQVTALIEAAPRYVRALAERYDWQLSDYEAQLTPLAQRVRENPGEILKTLFAGTSQAFGFIGNVISTTTYVAITAILLPIYFFFFAWRFHDMVHPLQRYIPAGNRQRSLEIITRMDQAVSSFFRGRLVIGLIMAVLFAVGWSPLLTDVPYWLVLALLTGLLSLIPYAAALGWLVALLLKALELSGASDMTTWGWVLGLGGLSLVYGIVQLFEGWLLTPWIQGKSLDLSAVTILIAVFVGAALGGLYGMILAIPITACGKILLREILLPRLAAWAKDN